MTGNVAFYVVDALIANMKNISNLSFWNTHFYYFSLLLKV